MKSDTVTTAITLRAASSDDPDPASAAAALIEELGTEAALYAIFTTAGYPRAPLAAALDRAWGERLIGCTSAGNIGPEGFVAAPVMAVALSGGDLTARTVVIEPISQLTAVLDRVTEQLDELCTPQPGRKTFALLLMDGLSLLEEHVTASLRPALADTPLIGGSAGDDLSFTETAVLHGGEFRPDRATVTVLSTTAPFRVFRLQHYQPSEKFLVITAATPEKRIVHDLNGMPAAQAFADAIGVPVAELGPAVYSSNPLILRAAGESWVRSIRRAFPDGSLQFFAAIDTGEVLRLAGSGDPVRHLRERFDQFGLDLGGRISGTLSFDCILRRLDFTRSGVDEAISEAMSEYGIAGFSTYGEQFEGFHMNQTMVGVAFGG
jgi:hypothetical protein